MPSNFAGRRKPGLMAILPQGDWVTLAHVVCEPNAKPEIRALDSFAVDAGLADALQRLRATRQLKSYACTTLLGNGEYNVTQLDAPQVPVEERKEALRWALRETVNYPLENACVEVLDSGGEGGAKGRPAGVLVVSAAEQAVLSRVAPFEAAKIPLDALDIPELAQRNVAALLEDENRGLAFLRIDETGLLLTLTFRGELVAVRRGEATSLQLNDPDEDARGRIKERLVLELQRSLDNFDRQYSHVPISKVVLATYPYVENLAAELGENTYIPVREMDLMPVLDFPAVPELRDPLCQAKNLLAIGAALRWRSGQPAAKGSASQQINLYEERLRPRRELPVARNLAIATLLVIVLMTAASLWARSGAQSKAEALAVLQKQLSSEQAQLAELSKTIAGRKVSSALAVELEAARAALAVRNEVIAVLDSGSLGNTSGFSAIMQGFARRSQPDLWLTGFSVSAGGEEIEIRGRLLDPARLPAYMQGLRSEPVFAGRRFAALEMKGVDPVELKAEAVGSPVPAVDSSAEETKLPRFVEFVLRSEKVAGADATDNSGVKQ